MEGSSVYRPCMTGSDLSLLEHEQGWNALDPKLGRELRFGLDVDLHKAGSWFKRLGGCRKNRGHRAAGTAPGRPEVRYHRNVVPGQVLLEACTTQSDGLTPEELGTALATLGGARGAGQRDPVDLVAFRADDVEGIRHERPPLRPFNGKNVGGVAADVETPWPCLGTCHPSCMLALRNQIMAAGDPCGPGAQRLSRGMGIFFGSGAPLERA